MPVEVKSKEKEKIYRYGDKAPDKAPAWQALTQVFDALAMNRATAGIDWKHGDFMVIETKGTPVAFVDLVTGELVPFSSVMYAVPAPA